MDGDSASLGVLTPLTGVNPMDLGLLACSLDVGFFIIERRPFGVDFAVGEVGLLPAGVLGPD
mgnify:CR=1 FL=1